MQVFPSSQACIFLAWSACARSAPRHCINRLATEARSAQCSSSSMRSSERKRWQRPNGRKNDLCRGSLAALIVWPAEAQSEISF